MKYIFLITLKYADFRLVVNLYNMVIQIFSVVTLKKPLEDKKNVTKQTNKQKNNLEFFRNILKSKIS